MKRPPLTQADRVYFAIAAAGGAAYVYRFATPFGNVSLFRIAILVGALLWLLRWIRFGVDRVALRVLPLFGAALFGPGLDFLQLSEDSPHRIGVIAYCVNLAGMAVMFSAIASRAALLEALRWFCYAAAASIVVAWYAWATGEIPGEELVRMFGSDYGRELAYLNVNEGTVRLTGPFFDPNFFGAYLVMTMSICQALWSVERKRRWLILAAACAVSLLATTSRTALLGLVVLVALGGEQSMRDVGKRLLTFVAATIVLVPIVGEFWDGFYDRLLNTDLTSRLEFLERGWHAFLQAPMLGAGSSILEDPETGYATAHTLYLSALANYGLIGGSLLLFFVFAPLAVVMQRRADRSSRRFVFAILLPLAAMYLTYDFFLVLEFQFLLFAMVYAIAFRGISIATTSRASVSVPNRVGVVEPAPDFLEKNSC